MGLISNSVKITPIPDFPAYWISPGGKVLPVGRNHIDEVVASPVSFGLTDEQVAGTFKKYREPLSFEGKARNEIMEGLIRKGWIRIRYYSRNDSYSVELNKLSKKVKDYLWAWTSGLLGENAERRYSGIRITEFAIDYYTYEFTLDELTKGQIYSKAELKAGAQESLVLVESVFDLLSIAPVMKQKKV